LSFKSASRLPDYIIPLMTAVSEPNNPLVIVRESSSAPSWIARKDLHCPLAAPSLLYLVLDVESVLIEIASVALFGLVCVVGCEGLLTICNAGSVVAEEGSH